MSEEQKGLFVCVDLHKRRWLVTVTDRDVELFSGSIPANWEPLRWILRRDREYKREDVHVFFTFSKNRGLFPLGHITFSQIEDPLKGHVVIFLHSFFPALGSFLF